MHVLVPLPKAEYKGYKLSFDYDTDAYYDVQMAGGRDGFSISLIRKPFPEIQAKRFVDAMYEDYLEDPEAYGVLKDGKPIAAIELSHEKWNNRLRVANIWVESSHRRAGLGRLLMDRAKEVAAQKKCRAVILETQTCNVKAIDFYLAQGFTLAGLDAYCYTNEDMTRKEVRIEMIWFPAP